MAPPNIPTNTSRAQLNQRQHDQLPPLPRFHSAQSHASRGSYLSQQSSAFEADDELSRASDDELESDSEADTDSYTDNHIMAPRRRSSAAASVRYSGEDSRRKSHAASLGREGRAVCFYGILMSSYQQRAQRS